MAIDLMRMVVGQIQLGQPLPFGVRDDHGTLLLAKGRVVATEAQLEILRTRGLYADHDDADPAEEAAAANAAPGRLAGCPGAQPGECGAGDEPQHRGGAGPHRHHGPPQRHAARPDGLHSQAAHDRLRDAGIDDADWPQAVLQHHERPGGGGHPSGTGAMGETARVLRMADVFMAKISPPTERPAIIREYGIYPPGNFVLLASGEMAVVIRRGATAHTPVAAAVTDKHGIPIVRTLRRNTAEPAWAIKSLVPESKMLLRVPPERLYGLVE